MEEQEFDRAGTLRTDLKIMIRLTKVASNDRNSKITGDTKWSRYLSKMEHMFLY